MQLDAEAEDQPFFKPHVIQTEPLIPRMGPGAEGAHPETQSEAQQTFQHPQPDPQTQTQPQTQAKGPAPDSVPPQSQRPQHGQQDSISTDASEQVGARGEGTGTGAEDEQRHEVNERVAAAVAVRNEAEE